MRTSIFKNKELIYLENLIQFDNKELEKEFIIEYDREQRVFYRLGIYLAIFGWAILIPVIYWIQKEFYEYFIATGVLAFSLFSFILYTIHKKELFTGHYQLFIGLTNFISTIALLFYFLLYFKPLWPFPALITVVTLAMFAVTLFRLRTFYSMIAVIGYLTFFLIMLFILKPDVFVAVFCVSVVFIFFPPILIGAYYSEQSARTIFIQKRLILAQKDEVDRLLSNILPLPIVERIKTESGHIANGFESVTVLFGDLVNFTMLAEKVTPNELVELLDQIFREFDNLTEEFHLEKIKTIGDAYMLVGGIPIPQKEQLKSVLEMSLAMQEVMKRKFSSFKSDEGNPLLLRIGIAIGPAVAGIIGSKKFSYDIWGDCVNTASRMESHGIPGRIQVTDEIQSLMKDKFIFEERGIVEIKGKGPMKVWFLNGKLLN
jgi:class 3 adenylate cyclase